MLKSICFTVLLFCISLFVNSQTLIKIGTGTLGNSPASYPCAIQDAYEGMRAQYLYKASELASAGMTAGTITAIKFQVLTLNSTGTSEQMTIKLGSTSGASLNNTSWIAGTQTVWGPVNYQAVSGTNTFTFSTPFYWNGFDNLVVEVCDGDPGNVNASTASNFNPSITLTTGLAFNGSHTYFADNKGNMCGKTDVVNNTASTNRPNITLVYTITPVNLLKVATFVDKNSNQVQDVNEPNYANIRYTTLKAGRDTIVTISSNGKANIVLDTGTYQTTAQGNLSYYNLTPAGRTTINGTYNNMDSVTFKLQPIAGKRDLAVMFFPTTALRPGFSDEYRLFYLNKGTDTVPAGYVEFIKEPRMNFSGASITPNQVSGDTMRWNYTNLKPDDTVQVKIFFSVNPPPSVISGHILCVSGTIFPLTADLVPADNKFRNCQFATSAFDPNDKTEAHAGSLSPTEVINKENLTYTIRFQNTGNDTAFNIQIRDTLSLNVDLGSFEMITASHAYQVTLRDNNLVWAFKNIYLVDSNRNEPKSHGYIVYRIRPKNTLVIGDRITNRASIYFDFNLPIVTNTDTLTVTANPLPLRLLTFHAYREGKINKLKWSTADERNMDAFEIERSATGNNYQRIGKVAPGRNIYHYTDASPLPFSYYRLKILNTDGSYSFSPVKLVKEEGSFSVGLQSNPVLNQLQLITHSRREVSIQIQIIDSDGKLITAASWTLPVGTGSKSFSTSRLRNGSYFIKIYSDYEKYTLPFQKM